ncbi:MAG: hypothetical protein H0X25_21475 [Acidobacteriales bacterium]|nr:hypothetical protein [Terriglobales bacterium]
MHVLSRGMMVVLFASMALAQAAQPELPYTQIKLFTPYAVGKLSQALKPSAPVKGSCFAASVADPSRESAWRCTAGNAIMDPCFQDLTSDPNQLACARAPWETEITMLSLTHPLPDTDKKTVDRDKAAPWALELANGDRCSLFTGATAPIGGMRINYGCPGGGQVIGDMDKSLPVWRVFYQKQGAPALEQVGVKAAWY